MDEPVQDPVEEAIDAAGLRSFIESRPDFKEVIRKAIQAHPLLARTEVQVHEEWHGHLWKHREWLTNLTYEGAAAFDRTLIALASGGIALSITFLNVFDPPPAISGTLLAAWSALVISILLTVLSMAASRWSVHAEIAAVDDLIKNPISLLEQPVRDERLPRRSQRLAWTTIALSAAAGVVFLVGMLGLICFAVDTREGTDEGSRTEAAPAAQAPAASETAADTGAGAAGAAEAPEAGPAGAAEGEERLRAPSAASPPPAAPAAGEEKQVGDQEK